MSCDNSLASASINSFVILIIYWLVDTWGCYGGCVFIGSASLFFILLLCRIYKHSILYGDDVDFLKCVFDA